MTNYLGEENDKRLQSATSGQLSCQLHFSVPKSMSGHSLKGESERIDWRQGDPLGYGCGPAHTCEWKAGRTIRSCCITWLPVGLRNGWKEEISLTGIVIKLIDQRQKTFFLRTGNVQCRCHIIESLQQPTKWEAVSVF